MKTEATPSSPTMSLDDLRKSLSSREEMKNYNLKDYERCTIKKTNLAQETGLDLKEKDVKYWVTRVYGVFDMFTNVKVGDRLITVNGRPVSDFANLDEIRDLFQRELQISVETVHCNFSDSMNQSITEVSMDVMEGDVVKVRDIFASPELTGKKAKVRRETGKGRFLIELMESGEKLVVSSMNLDYDLDLDGIQAQKNQYQEDEVNNKSEKLKAGGLEALQRYIMSRGGPPATGYTCNINPGKNNKHEINYYSPTGQKFKSREEVWVFLNPKPKTEGFTPEEELAIEDLKRFQKKNSMIDSAASLGMSATFGSIKSPKVLKKKMDKAKKLMFEEEKAKGRASKKFQKLQEKLDQYQSELEELEPQEATLPDESPLTDGFERAEQEEEEHQEEK